MYLAADATPEGWSRYSAPETLGQVGSQVHRASAARGAILIVPFALTPIEDNWLLNPAHPEFASIEVLPTAPFQCNSRLISK